MALILSLILSLLFLQLLPLSVMGSSSALPVNQESAHILLEVKALLTDPTSSLRSWKQDRISTLCDDWNGITCASFAIVGIDLSYKNLSGSLSPAIGALSSLQVLNMSSNMLTGRVPAEIKGCKSLRSLDLSNNNFTGELPSGLSELTRLETLSLWTNSFVGSIPQDILLCSQLKYLDLGGSYLQGEIPQAIGNLTNLVYLTLAGNELTGEIPSSFGHLQKLEWIYIGYNQLSGSIPPQLGQLSSLKHLDLVHNNLTGAFPHSLTNLTNLEYLFLYDNQLEGFIPPSIANLTKLFSLDLSSNLMSGSIPSGISNLGQLQILNLFDNRFSGEIPHTLAEMESLQVLALWMNKLTGRVPEKLGSLNNLTLLDLSSNELRGHIPEHLCASEHLHNLILFSNSMSGPIPQSLAACRSLQRVRLEGNLFSGSIPAGLASLPHVYYLDLSSNNFSGSLDSFAWNSPGLQVLHLRGNHLTGSIPPSLQNSISLEILDLSQNGLVGDIPLELGSLPKLNKLFLNDNLLSGNIENGGFLMCRQLTDINLSNNQLTGCIPTALARLESLSTLDLSYNKFSGAIPPQLGDMDSLVFVSLSFNQLSGEIPQSGAFIQINASSIEGNPGLCGGILGPCHVNSATDQHALIGGSIKARITALLLLIGLLISVVGIGNVIWKIKHGERQGKSIKKLQCKTGKASWAHRHEWTLTLFQTVRPSVEEILEAMQEENVVEKMNTSCVLYKGSTMKGGVQFAAMEIILSSCDNELVDDRSRDRSMRAILGMIGKSNHPNLVNVYGICCGMASSIVVLELVNGGCRLRSLLELPGRQRGGVNVLFDIERRLQVAIDIAEAIVHLHSYCSPPILHGSVSSNNVIVDNDFVARLLPPNTSSARFIYASSADKEAEDGKGDGFVDDVRAFGSMLVELVKGAPHYTRSAAEAGAGDREQLHSSLSVAAAETGRDMEQVLMRASEPSAHWRGSGEQLSTVRLECSWCRSTAAELERVGQELTRAATGAELRQGLRVLRGIRRRRHPSGGSGTPECLSSTLTPHQLQCRLVK